MPFLTLNQKRLFDWHYIQTTQLRKLTFLGLPFRLKFAAFVFCLHTLPKPVPRTIKRPIKSIRNYTIGINWLTTRNWFLTNQNKHANNLNNSKGAGSGMQPTSGLIFLMQMPPQIQ